MFAIRKYLRALAASLALVFAALSPHAAAAAAAFVNAVATTGGATVSFTLSAGQQVVLFAGDFNVQNATISATDNLGNTYVLRGTSNDTEFGGTYAILDCLTPSATGAITITFASSGGNPIGVAAIYTGLASFSAASFEHAFNSSITGTQSTSTITPTSFPAAVISFYNAGSGTFAAGTGFTQDEEFNPTNNSQIAGVEHINVASGTQAGSWTVTTGVSSTVQAVAYLESGATGATLTGAASDTTSVAAALTAPPAPFAPILINMGTGPNTGTGDSLDVAFPKINEMVDQLFPDRSTQTPTTGFSITPAQGVTRLVLTPAGTLASGTVNMPANPADDQPFMVMTSQTITTITFMPAAGQTLSSAPTTLTNAAAVKWIYQAASGAWFREH